MHVPHSLCKFYRLLGLFSALDSTGSDNQCRLKVKHAITSATLHCTSPCQWKLKDRGPRHYHQPHSLDISAVRHRFIFRMLQPFDFGQCRHCPTNFKCGRRIYRASTNPPDRDGSPEAESRLKADPARPSGRSYPCRAGTLQRRTRSDGLSGETYSSDIAGTINVGDFH